MNCTQARLSCGSNRQYICSTTETETFKILDISPEHTTARN